MNVVDLHPEQLFDAMREGRLSADDRVRLDAHCAHCAACSFELRWLEDEPVAPEPSAEDHAYGEAALNHVLQLHEAPRTVLPNPSRHLPLRLGVGGLVLACAIGLVLLLGRVHGTVTPAVAPVAPVLPPPPSEPVPQAELEAAVPRGQESAPPRAAAVPSANELLASARRAHSRGQIDRAHRLYRQVIETYAASSAAGTAHVALGRLLYEDEQEPSAALVEFERYLHRRPSGALAEEALFYRALSFERLGDSERAAESLRTLLKVYPRSVYAASARARLRR
jgi:tetratricopeptide (TPR) repeat protein